MNEKVKRREKRVRVKIAGQKAYPRLSVFRSHRHLYAQIIDDQKGQTLASANTLKGKKCEAGQVGKEIAAKALKKGIKKVVFDRGRYRYHGKIKTIAENARKGGLEF